MRFSNRYDEDDDRGRSRSRRFPSRFRHDEDDGEDYSHSQRFDNDDFEVRYKKRLDNGRYQKREKPNYKEFEKDFYTEHEHVKNRSPVSTCINMFCYFILSSWRGRDV